MDLKIFFSPVDEAVFEGIDDPTSFFRSISVFAESQPAYKGANIALIGVVEDGGCPTNQGAALGADEIRKKLYRLKKGFGQYKIVDLGNLRKGIDLLESQMRLKEVCAVLIAHEVLPIIIGGTHDHTYAQYLAYEHLDKLVSLLNVDAFLDIENAGQGVHASNHLHKILLHEPNFLFSLNQLAHQSYLIDNETLAVLEKLYFDAHRLGHLRQHLPDMEPIIRDADLMSFDITAIKSSDAPGNRNAQPFGLTGEEACQICWYAGLNEKMSSVGFYEYNPEADDTNKKTASVVATMIWYFVEGFYHRKDEHNFRSNDYLRFVVSMPSEPENMVFYKSKLSEKWWMEVPYPHAKFLYERNLIVPCSYSDYQLAANGEIPERWITTQAKLI
ncbi:MAG: formimidoylglutamase [Cyclobacteriaceae bacterium]|nr:formimidoylglutamase [Cyclobacteriaceae bacterium]